MLLLNGLVRSWHYLQGSENDYSGRVQILEKMSYSESEFPRAGGCSYPRREVCVCVCVGAYTHIHAQTALIFMGRALEFVSRKCLLPSYLGPLPHEQ